MVSNIYSANETMKFLGSKVYSKELPKDFDEKVLDVLNARGIAYNELWFMVMADAFVLGKESAR